MNELKPEAIKELRRTMSTLGQAEAELACKKISGKKLTYISEMVEAMRVEVRAFREPFIPENAAFSSEAWRDLYNQINDAAARELSKSVDDKISALEAEKASIDSALIAEKAEVNRKWNEFDSIATKAVGTKNQIAGYIQARVNINSVEADYEQAFESICTGARVNPDALSNLADTIVTKAIRLRVIDKMEAKAKVYLDSLRKQNKELAKELNLTPHDI